MIWASFSTAIEQELSFAPATRLSSIIKGKSINSYRTGLIQSHQKDKVIPVALSRLQRSQWARTERKRHPLLLNLHVQYDNSSTAYILCPSPVSIVIVGYIRSPCSNY
ncbi:hypothetical protein LENED_011202 [Lentinula edodes]|uniref:Uncharacterized protein n=1 Tax=Lentinula edodes TaxID=5353 RepID=A0A1Q3EPE7_LENED|nr:hypothetical protein LENED_011202 [Lentinula edodes]